MYINVDLYVWFCLLLKVLASQVWKYHIRVGGFWNVCEFCILSYSWTKHQINIFWDKKKQFFKEIINKLNIYVMFPLKPHYDNTLLISMLQLCTLYFNHWESQQLTASQYVHCLISNADEGEVWTEADGRQRYWHSTIILVWKNNQRMTLIKYSDSYTNFLKILLITSFIFEVPESHTWNKIFL